MNARRNPGRETLQPTAVEKSYLPEGMGFNRMIVLAIGLHMYASGINPVSYHPAGYYALKDNTIFVVLHADRLFYGQRLDYLQHRFQVHGRAEIRHRPGEGRREESLADCQKHLPSVRRSLSCGVALLPLLRETDSLPRWYL